MIAGCSDDNSPGQPQSEPSAPPPAANAKHGPTFPECGGISDQTVGQLTQVAGLVNTAKNSVGCQWLANGGIVGPHFSFTWFRGSPIGRERKTEELSRTSVEDINIERPRAGSSRSARIPRWATISARSASSSTTTSSNGR